MTSYYFSTKVPFLVNHLIVIIIVIIVSRFSPVLWCLSGSSSLTQQLPTA